MADENVKIGLDATGFEAGADGLEQALNAINTAIDGAIVKMVKFNDQGEQLQAQVTRLTKDNLELSESWGLVASKLDPAIKNFERISTTVRVASSELAKFRKEQEAIANAKAGTSAKQFLADQGIDLTNVPPELAGAASRAQQVLADAFKGSLDDAAPVATQIAARLKQGATDFEVGFRGAIQQGLIGINNIVNKASSLRTAGANQQADAAAAAARSASVDLLKKDFTDAFPVPSKASFASILQYQQSLNNLFNTLKNGKVPLSEFTTLLNNVKKNPFGDFSKGNQDIQQLQTQLLKTVGAFKATEESAQRAEDRIGRFGSSALLGIQSIVRIIEAQIIHRFFGQLITDLEGSITASIEFSKAIAKVQTIGESLGLSTGQLSSRVSDLSVQFNRTPTDVAEGLYQGLSNQVIKTSGDIGFLSDALSLSRVTFSTTAQGVDALSSVINAYGLSTGDAARISAQLFRAVDLGRFELKDIAGTLGRVTVSANDLKIPFEEVLATLTLITRAGVPASEAMTQLSSIMQVLARPTDKIKELFKSWGFETVAQGRNILGFQGILAKFNQEAQKGNDIIGELTGNVRAARGFRLLTGDTGAQNFQNEVSQFTDTGRLEAGFQQATQRVVSAPGEILTQQLNRVKVEVIKNFGEPFIQAILDIGAPFGGISNLILKFTEDLGNLAKVGLGAASILTNLASSIQGITNPLNAFSNVNAKVGIDLTHIAGLVGAFSLAKFGLGKFFGDAATGAVSFTSALGGLGTAITSLGPSIAVAFAVDNVVKLVTELVTAEGATKRFNDELKKTRDLQEARRQQQNSIDSQTNQGVDRQVETIRARITSIYAPLTEATNKARDQQRSVFSDTQNLVAGASRNITDLIANNIRRLEQTIRNSQTNIRDSASRLLKFRDEIATTLFQTQLGQLGQGPTRITPFSNPLEQNTAGLELEAKRLQLRAQQELITERIRKLEQDAEDAFNRGDLRGAEEARRKVEEARTLTRQLFDLQTNFRREQEAFRLRVSGATGLIPFRIDTNPLERALGDLNDLERTGERAFQNAQIRREAQAQAVLEIERRRQVEVTRTQTALSGFSLLDSSGQLEQRFQGAQGGQAALDRLRELERAAQRALAPVQLTVEQIRQLSTRVGQEQTGVIQTALREGTITPEQARQLNTVLTNAQTEALQQQLTNFQQHQQALTALAVAVGRQREQILTTIAREQQAIRLREQQEAQARSVAENQALLRSSQDSRIQGEAQRNTGFNDLSSILESIRLRTDQGALTATQRISAADGAPEIRARREEVERLALAAQALQRTAAADPTVANTEALISAQRRLSESYEILLRRQQEFNTRGFFEGQRPLAGIQLNQDQITALNAQRDASRNIDLGQERVQTALSNIEKARRAIDELEVLLGGTLPKTLEEAARQAGNLGASLTRGLTPAQDAIISLNQQLAVTIQRMNTINAVVPAGANPNFVDPLAGVEGFAEGGLIGGAFSSRGPDNMVIGARGGEFMMNSQATRDFYPQLVAMNSGRGYAQGGTVSNNTSVGDISINVSGDRNPDQTARAVYEKFRRETRRRR